MSDLQDVIDCPPCPFCGSDDTWLMGTYDTVDEAFAVWACNNPDCPNVEFEHFFSQEDIDAN